MRVRIAMIVMVLAAALSALAEGMEIPIELDRHRTIVPVSVNGSRPMRLILDTGMTFDGVFLFHQDQTAGIDTTGSVPVLVPGAGGGEPSEALMIEDGRLRLGDLELGGQRVLIAQGGPTQGFPTDGVIGASLFRHHIVQIDHEKRRMTLHPPDWEPQPDEWTELPITLVKGIPWLDVTVEVVEGEALPMRAYIDLASGDALELLTGPAQRFTLPAGLVDDYLGTGLSGDIHGQRGRCRSLEIGGFRLTDLPAVFAPAALRSKQDGADLILGNAALESFHMAFDYFNGRLLLRPIGEDGLSGMNRGSAESGTGH